MGSVIRRPNSIRKNRWGGGGSFSRVKKERERNDKSGGRGDDEEKDERVGKREKGNRNRKKISAQRGEARQIPGKEKRATTLNPAQMAWHSHATRLSSCFPLYFE